MPPRAACWRPWLIFTQGVLDPLTGNTGLMIYITEESGVGLALITLVVATYSGEYGGRHLCSLNRRRPSRPSRQNRPAQFRSALGSTL